MAVDITALYCCLDDFCKVFADWEVHRLLSSQTTRQRTGKLSRAEMLFIVVLFHLSPYKNFKVFYLYGIGGQYRACFDELPHYDRFASLVPLPVRLKAQKLRQALLAFQKIDIDIWLIERHGCLSPAEYRTQQLQSLSQAP